LFLRADFGGDIHMKNDGESRFGLRVVIVGGGFGGLAAAKSLRTAPVEITLVDRSNHHLFQPLLYQVATSVLSPGQIAAPIREVIGRQRNTTVLLGEAVGIDASKQRLLVAGEDGTTQSLPYDILILATGMRTSYFGHEEFSTFAPGLKSLADAVSVRNRLLKAFESAEAEEDAGKRAAHLTFVLVGGGPTGVEMAAAISVLARRTMRSEFRRIDPGTVRIVLIDVGKRILAAFSEKVSAAAEAHLTELGVELLLGRKVEKIEATGVSVSGEWIPSATVIWAAGVACCPVGEWLGIPTDSAGRLKVGPDLSLPNHPEIFAIGDTASYIQNEKPLPGVAQVALQQGHYVGRLLRGRLGGRPAPAAFRYFDKGNMAVVGRGYAVLERGSFHFCGFLAWLAWAGIHLQFLALFGLRVSVFVQWVWTYVTDQRGSRIIVNHRQPTPQRSVETKTGA
jgi:NADH dehydrogenase